MRIPEAFDTGKVVASCISMLWGNYSEHLQAQPDSLPLYDKASRYACGYPVPAFQRELCWTQEQKVKFIESLWLGFNPGTYTVHRADWQKGGLPEMFSGWLIDGQQRLSTIQSYWEDGFKVFGLYWSELSKIEMRRFHSIKFEHTEVAVWDEKLIRELYNRMAFGGTAHTEAQRA